MALAGSRVAALMQEATWGAGLLGAATSYHLAAGGRAWRARLALDCCAALGVTAENAAGLAAACELVHEASLVHDDVQDGTARRRGRPSVSARFGDAVAICTGDHLLTAAFGQLAALPHAPALIRLFAARVNEMVAGQAEEFDPDLWATMTWDRYALLAGAKAGALVCLPVEGAALLAGLHAEQAALAARRLGVAYQVSDDVADLAPDLARGALNGVVAYALQAGTAAGRADLLSIIAQLRTGTPDTNGVMAERQAARLAPEAGRVLAWARGVLGGLSGMPQGHPLAPVLAGMADALADRLGAPAHAA